jgi:hypothetical protein
MNGYRLRIGCLNHLKSYGSIGVIAKFYLDVGHMKAKRRPIASHPKDGIHWKMKNADGQDIGNIIALTSPNRPKENDS